LGFVVLETLRKHSKGQDFSSRHSLVSRCAIRENARKFRDFSDPTPVFFLLVLNSEGRHVCDSTLGRKLPPNAGAQRRRASVASEGKLAEQRDAAASAGAPG